MTATMDELAGGGWVTDSHGIRRWQEDAPAMSRAERLEAHRAALRREQRLLEEISALDGWISRESKTIPTATTSTPERTTCGIDGCLIWVGENCPACQVRLLKPGRRAA